jgi:erythromycin esterase
MAEKSPMQTIPLEEIFTMKKTLLILGLSLLIISLIICGCLSLKENSFLSEQLQEEFNRSIVELPCCSPLQFPDDSFADLDSLFSRAKIFGLGEATHGTKEFFELKHRLLRYLVENHGVRALGFEYDFRFNSSLDIERFVTEGDGTLDILISDTYWTHRNEELRNLLSWMKEYNSGKSEQEIVHFIGIDSQLDIWDCDELADLISQFDECLYEFVQKNISQIECYGKIDHKNLTSEEYEEIKLLLTELKKQIEKYYAEHSNTVNEKKRMLVLHLIESYILSHEFRFLLYRKQNVRDRHMAEHSLWLSEFVGENQKVVIWAHNAHVAINPDYSSEGAPSMGKFLKDRLGDGYLAVATSFSNGVFTAVTEDCFGEDTEPILWEIRGDPPSNSVNYLFHKAKYQNFMLSIATLCPQSELFNFLDQPKPFFGIGDFFTRDIEYHYQNDRIANLARFFDVLFHFKNTAAINILK